MLFGTWDNASNYLSFLKNKKEEAHNEASPVNQRKSLHVRIHADFKIMEISRHEYELKPQVASMTELTQVTGFANEHLTVHLS